MYLNLHNQNAVILNISEFTDVLPIEDWFDGFTTGYVTETVKCCLHV